MSLFDSLVGGLVGAGAASVISEFVENHGGVQGIVTQFQEKGLSETVLSWVGTGVNQPVTAEQIQNVLGSEAVTRLAENLGLPVEQITAQLSEYLPQLIDSLTPDGQIPVAKSGL